MAWYLETNLLWGFSHLAIWTPRFSICEEKAELYDFQIELAPSSNKQLLREPPSLVAQTVKRLPTMWETQVQSLGREDLEKEIATHSSILAWKIPWMEKPSRL